MEKASAFGNYRAVVVDNKDKEQFGRVLVWIPSIMPEIDRSKGSWARPANNPIGGRNKEDNEDNYYGGTSYIPRKGSWVFVFFEGGNINRPYYFGALDLENTKVLPENQVGSNYENKWTILKSGEGRTVVISDDPDDARTEITGKKRQINSPPTGDTASVYTIDGNQTTILFDERSGKEKILIRTYKGDFFHIDVDEQKLQIEFFSDIEIKTNGKFNVTALGDINLLSTAGNVNIQSASGQINSSSALQYNIQSGKDTNILSAANINLTAALKNNLASTTDTNILATTNLNLSAGSIINEKATGNINTDGAARYDQSGLAVVATPTIASPATPATPAVPEGDRDT
jgi:hypothetical protein